MQVSTVLSKFEMSEEDIKLQYITPAIIAKWNIGRITMETQVTDGKINLRGNFVSREKPKRADYILYLNVNNPIAIIEAKDNNDDLFLSESADLLFHYLILLQAKGFKLNDVVEVLKSREK